MLGLLTWNLQLSLSLEKVGVCVDECLSLESIVSLLFCSAPHEHLFPSLLFRNRNAIRGDSVAVSTYIDVSDGDTWHDCGRTSESVVSN